MLSCEPLLQDLRYSLRQFFLNPGFSLTALISLALGIGAATAVFSVLYSGLLHPYPYRAAENLVTLASTIHRVTVLLSG